MLLWAASSILVAQLVVPGSWIDTRWHLAREILSGSDASWVNAVVGAVLVLLYLTFYRWVRPRLPAGLRFETVNPTWKDVRVYGLLFFVSVVLGLIIIT
jgi:fumarate reductase subunit D